MGHGGRTGAGRQGAARLRRAARRHGGEGGREDEGGGPGGERAGGGGGGGGGGLPGREAAGRGGPRGGGGKAKVAVRAANGRGAAVVEGVEVYPVESLRDVAGLVTEPGSRAPLVG